MSRVHFALSVRDLSVAVEFYRKLFGVEPAKLHPGYANFAISEPPLKLVLIENSAAAGQLNHLGMQDPDGTNWEVYTVDFIGNEVLCPGIVFWRGEAAPKNNFR